MLNKSIIEDIITISLSKGGDFAEVFVEETYNTNLVLVGDTLEQGMAGKDFGVGIRVLDNLNSVYAYTNSLSKDDLIETANKISATIEITKNNVSFKLNSPTTKEIHPINIYPKDIELKKKISIMDKAYHAAYNYDPSIKQVIVRYLDQEQNVLIANSDGLFKEDTRVKTRLLVSTVAEINGSIQTGYHGPGAAKGMEFYDNLPIEFYGEDAARMAKLMAEADPCPSGQMPVIVENGFGGLMIHEACGHSLEASFVAKGNSQFSNMINKRIANEQVTLIDDGSITNEWGSLGMDDEGHDTQKNILIENGVLKSYLVDKLNGRRLKMKPTGSARRQSYRFAPTSRMTNTYIDNGNFSREDIISNTEYGLYAKHLDGGSVNPATGDYNFTVVEGYLIKNGKIDKPVKGATLIGNGADTLLNIDMVGNNLKLGQGFCYASSGTLFITAGQPTVRIKSLTVGGSE